MTKKKKSLLLPVAGGKGGTGKSLITVNLGLALARQGRKTLMADLDLGGSNLHTLIGHKNLQPGLGRLLVEKGLKLADLIAETRWPGLFYIPGDNQVPRAANPYYTQKKKILSGLKNVDFEVVLADLGAGSSLTVLDFFLMSPQGIVVLTPELPSLLNAYVFLRQVLFRALWLVLKSNHYAVQVLEAYRVSPTGPKSWTVDRLLEELARQAPGQENRARKILNWWRPGLVLNQVQEESDLTSLGHLIKLARAKLSVNPICLGVLPRDELVVASVKARRPAVELNPQSVYCRAMTELAGRAEAWRSITMEDMSQSVKSWGLDQTRPGSAGPAADAPELNQLLAEMLPVVDDLTRALNAARKEGQEAVAQGLEAVLKNHLLRLANQGLKPIPAMGREFDPRFHQAVAVKKRPGVAKGRILAEVSRGFTLNGQLFRPAQVVVAE
ncbi:MAG: nucleotide exchange factor GrpE [Deltaproteobacteria bacterium]|nr:nucleotide exchange factor GrpE [Deltaproteobacteria bacterium]